MPAEHVTPIHDDEAWEDTVEHTSTGVKDILVTGKVCKAFSSLSQFHSLIFTADKSTARRGMGTLHYSRQGECIVDEIQ
jgi:hypothetical protein